MTKIKLCGLSRECDIEIVNKLVPEYVGFILSKPFRRYVDPEKVKELTTRLDPQIQAVGVFVNEELEFVAQLLEQNVIDVAQLHGKEDESYIQELKKRTGKTIIKAFKVTDETILEQAKNCSADYVLLDAGCGTGTMFDWSLIKNVDRPYFLAGGLHPGNASKAVKECRPYAVDVSSGIETDGIKDKEKMIAFVKAVREQ